MTLLLLFNSPASATTPTVTTDSISSVQRKSAIAAGTVVSDGGSTITERGFVVSTTGTPTIDDTKYVVSGTTGSFTETLEPLAVGQKYYVRAYATNGEGTSYGDTLTFTTPLSLVQKHFYYKVFDAGEYVTTWSKEVLTEPDFKSNINGGAGELIIELGRTFDDFGEDIDVKLNNRIECWVVDKDNPDGLLLYAGYISGYRPLVRETEEKVIITVLGYIAEMQRIILRDNSDNTTLTYNSYDPANILKDVIDKYQAQGGTLRYTMDSIQLTSTTVSYTFNTNTIKECMDKIIELCPEGWYWRVDPNDVVYLQPRNPLADHTFTLGLDIENLETFRRVEDLVNRVLFIGAGEPALYKMYENSGSQSSYGLYEKKIVDQRVSVEATAQTIADREINTKKDPEIRSTFTIIDNNGPRDRGYNIESVKVGETLKVRNLKSAIRNITLWDVALWDVDVWDQTLETSAADVIQILSVSYRPDSVVIEASSRLPQIAKRIEDIQRNLEVTQSVNNPTAPT